MLENPFDGLRHDFRAAEARFGYGDFYLFAVTKEEFEADRTLLTGVVAGCVGFVPIGHANERGIAPGYVILGPVVGIYGRSEVRDTAPYERFVKIAGKAGTSLSAVTQARIEEQVAAPFAPAAWWLTFMWLFKPPSKLPLPDDKFSRIIWWQPFRDSANVIERSGLCNGTPPAGNNGDGAKHEKLAPQGQPVVEFHPQELCVFLDVEARTVNRYAKKAGVDTPKRGENDRKYTLDEAIRIVRAVQEGTRKLDVEQRCKAKLAEWCPQEKTDK